MSNGESRLSHFDAWGLGENPSKKRKTRIENLEDLERMRLLIGDVNVTEGAKLLRDGGQMWVFRSIKEVEADPDLLDNEKEFCRKAFHAGEKWKGIVRTPSRCPDPSMYWAYPSSSRYDSHGNYHGGGSGYSEGARH